MKYNSLFKFFLFCLVCAFVAVSCTKEGPMGMAGADGKDGQDGSDGRDGVDGNVTCLVCHSSTNIEAVQGQFAMSVHRAGLVAVDYAGGRSYCAQCHSHEGFVQFAEFGKVFGNITNPTAWKCNTCHGLHKTFEAQDYALRLSDPVNPLFAPDTEMDLLGNSNLCANCHQSRRAEPALTHPGEETFTITSTHWGPHHGAQSNVVAGVGFAEIEGSVAYPEPGTSKHLNQASCVGCHMGEFTQGTGGHTWNPSLKACNDCHGVELDDFNYGGVQSDVKAKLDQIGELLVEFGVMEGDEEHGFHPVPGTYPTVLARAFFNWVGLDEDRSLGAHNPKYVKALLTNTIEALEAYEEAMP